MDRNETRGHESRFSTRALEPAGRFEAWRRSIGVLFDVEQPATATPFDSEIHAFLLNHMMLALCRSGAQRFVRSNLRLGQDGLDYYCAQLFLEGGQQHRRGGTVLQCRAGDIAIYDFADQHYAETEPFANLSLIVPRATLSPLLRSPDSINGLLISADAPLAAVLTQHMMSLFKSAPELSDQESALLLEPTCSLVAAVINGHDDDLVDVPTAVSRSQAFRARDFIHRNLEEADLTPERIAQAIGVSRAALYRLFSNEGGVQAWIRRQRVFEAARRLTDPKHREVPIGEIAWSLGFRSETVFSRNFREEFGVTPSAARGSGISARRALDLHEPGPVGDHRYEYWLEEVLRGERA